VLVSALPSAVFGLSAPWTWPCDSSTYSSLPFCDTSLDVETRAADYVSRISLDDKLGRNQLTTPLSNTASPMASVGVGEYQWWSEALHGVASSPGVSFDVIKSATSFPQVCGLIYMSLLNIFLPFFLLAFVYAHTLSHLGHCNVHEFQPYSLCCRGRCHFHRGSSLRQLQPIRIHLLDPKS
jgi:hypothetical protein